jgi:Rrf2 family protein
MAANSRFSLALNIMTHLAYNAGQAMTSPQLAKAAGTNAVVVRRFLSQLRNAGLVTCHPGKSGGCQIDRTLRSISLFDIYKAVEGGSPFAIPEMPENKACAVSCRMKSLLSSVLAETERAVAASLERVRLSDLIEEVEKSAKTVHA